jgi:hypothetical protein
LDHVDLSNLPTFTDTTDTTEGPADTDDTEVDGTDGSADGHGADGDDAGADGRATGDGTERTGADCEVCRKRAAGRRSPVETVVNLVIDGESFLHGLELLLGLSGFRKTRTPFGPDRGLCQTFDGDPIALRDTVAAALADKIRIVLRNTDGTTAAMSSKQRLFTGAIRDAVLLTATHCTHPGCIVAASHCQIDHMNPHSNGGTTDTINATIDCGHHNRWKHAHGIRTTRLPDGTIATYRPNGTRIAPPPT